jgi:hypothetical protein
VAKKPLDSVAAGDLVAFDWPGRAQRRVLVTRITPTLIETEGGNLWRRRTGLPVPMRMYQGQRINACEQQGAAAEAELVGGLGTEE